MSDGVPGLVVIGGGNMGSAVVRAAYTGRIRAADTITVAEPDGAKRAALQTEYSGGVRVVAGAAEAVKSGGLGARIVVAVKPQMFPQVAAELVGAKVIRDQLFVSIMAGVRAVAVYERLDGGRELGRHIRVMRAMPNLALAHGEGVTAVCGGPGATSDDVAFAESLFAFGGEVVRIGEDLFDAFTALAGSGPAYVFYLAEAMERSGVAMGFTAEESRRIVRQTVLGAAAMLRAGDRAASPADLRASVTSKGGVTEAAARVLEMERVGEAVVRAIMAGRDRGRELSA